MGGVGDGTERYRQVPRTTADGCQRPAAADDSGADAHGGGPGTGATYNRAMGVGLRGGRTSSPDIPADRWLPPALEQAQKEVSKTAVQKTPAASIIKLANWYWKVVRQFVSERFGISRISCLNYLHRLGFSFKRTKRRLLKADETKREAFVAEYAALVEESRRRGAKIFFADEGPFPCRCRVAEQVGAARGTRAGGVDQPKLRGEGQLLLGGVAWRMARWSGMELEGNSNSETSVAFLGQLGERHPGPLQVIWDNAPAHRGRCDAGIPQDARAEPAIDESVEIQPGLQR